jgi:hypothetical protein
VATCLSVGGAHAAVERGVMLAIANCVPLQACVSCISTQEISRQTVPTAESYSCGDEKTCSVATPACLGGFRIRQASCWAPRKCMCTVHAPSARAACPPCTRCTSQTSALLASNDDIQWTAFRDDEIQGSCLILTKERYALRVGRGSDRTITSPGVGLTPEVCWRRSCPCAGACSTSTARVSCTCCMSYV